MADPLVGESSPEGAHAEIQGLLSAQGSSVSPSDKGEAQKVDGEGESSDEDDVFLGSKTIGGFASVAFIANQVYGPGMMVIPIAILKCGWLPVVSFNLLFFAVSTVCALMLCEAISMIEGNQQFELRIEFATLVSAYFSHPWDYLSRLCFHISIQAMNIGSIVICSQAADNAIIWIFGCSPGLALNGDSVEGGPGWKCFKASQNSGHVPINSVYSGLADEIAITAGYVLVTVIALPLGFLNLADSMSLQIVSFVFTTVILAVFFVQFCVDIARDDPESQDGRIHSLGDNFELVVTALSVSYMYVMYLPAWINEKTHQVPIKATLWMVAGAAMVCYIVIGLMCAAANPDMKNDNVLQHLYEYSSPFIGVMVLIFAFTAVLPGIPINAIAVRYNLYVSGMCTSKQSYFWGAVAPFTVSWLFTSREMCVGVLMWILVIAGGVVTYIVPPMLYYMACRDGGTTFTPNDLWPAEENPGRPTGLAANKAPKDGYFHHTSPTRSGGDAAPWSPVKMFKPERFVLCSPEWHSKYHGKLVVGVLVFYLVVLLLAFLDRIVNGN